MKLLFVLLAPLLFGTPHQVNNLRRVYFDAAADKTQMDVFKKHLDSYRNRDHYFYCYLSAYNSLQSKHASSVSKKMEYFNLCKKNIGQSLKIKDSFDARFIRFCIQCKTPRLLGYKNELEQDKTFILENLKGLDNHEYKQKVKDFLGKSETLNPGEKKQLENL